MQYSLIIHHYAGELALLFRTVGWNPPFVFEGAWPDPWRLAVPPVERITPLLGFAFAWPLLMQLLTSSVFTLSAVAAGKASKPSELAAKLRDEGEEEKKCKLLSVKVLRLASTSV